MSIMAIQRSGLIEIHASVLLFGLAGLFGKFLTLPAWRIVLGRTGFASFALGMVLRFSTRNQWPREGKTICLFACLGMVLAVHWITFSHCMALPFFCCTKHRLAHTLAGGAVILMTALVSMVRRADI